MLTEMPRTSVPLVEHSRPIKTIPSRISPIVISASLCFVLLHVFTGIMLGSSHVRPSIAPAALVADNGGKCSAKASAPEPSLQNVWSPGSD